MLSGCIKLEIENVNTLDFHTHGLAWLNATLTRKNILISLRTFMKYSGKSSNLFCFQGILRTMKGSLKDSMYESGR